MLNYGQKRIRNQSPTKGGKKCWDRIFEMLTHFVNLMTSFFDFWQTLLEERRELQQSNYLLQHKLAEHFRKKKADDARQDYDKTANDQDSKYVKYMGR